MKRTEEEWKQKLKKDEFRVLRGKGTERPFSGKYNKNKRKGVYVCKACGNKVFVSENKFDSGSGWPSFSKAENIKKKKDNSWFMRRTEVICKKCGSHLGHIFDDGPQPTGKRHCINGVSLVFKAA